MKQNKLMKHLKKAISHTGSRPMLECAHYDTDGSITVTDSHRLIRIENFHKNEEGFNLNLLTMELDEGSYPETSRLIPDIEDAKTKLTISLGALKRAVTSLKNGTGGAVNIQMFDDYIILYNSSDKYENVKFEIKLNVAIKGERFPIAFDTNYLLDAVNFLLDAKQRFALDNVVFHMTSPIRPVVLKIEEQQYTYLVTPVRTF